MLFGVHVRLDYYFSVPHVPGCSFGSCVLRDLRRQVDPVPKSRSSDNCKTRCLRDSSTGPVESHDSSTGPEMDIHVLVQTEGRQNCWFYRGP